MQVVRPSTDEEILLSISKNIVCEVSCRLLFVEFVSCQLLMSFLFQEGKLLSSRKRTDPKNGGRELTPQTMFLLIDNI